MDFDQGFVFDYNLKSWVIKEVYQYDWGKNNFTSEYKIDAGDEVGFLSVANEGELHISFSKPIKIQQLGEGLREQFVRVKVPLTA